jgi:hypothetical protein
MNAALIAGIGIGPKPATLSARSPGEGGVPWLLHIGAMVTALLEKRDDKWVVK